MQKEDCVFCNLVNDKNRNIWENSLFYVMFDTFPVTRGHAIIVPKRHVVSFKDLLQEEWIDLKSVVGKIIDLIEKTDFKSLYGHMLGYVDDERSVQFIKSILKQPWLNSKPDSYNYGVNDGKEAGRTYDHFHWHIIPRYKGDMADPRGGVRHVIPERGNYKKTTS